VEGAHTWDIAGRGIDCEIISDMNQPWGSSESCTSCGKCVLVCPTGALFEKGATVSGIEKNREFLKYIVTARTQKEWVNENDEEE
jgi:bidirectional [NiFe] hydrogenase diaphorase subunit